MCLPLKKTKKQNNSVPFSIFGFTSGQYNRTLAYTTPKIDIYKIFIIDLV